MRNLIWNETYVAGILRRSSGTNISTKNSSFVVYIFTFVVRLFPIFKQLLAMFQWKYWHSDLMQQTWIVVFLRINVHISPAFEKFKLYVHIWCFIVSAFLDRFSKFEMIINMLFFETCFLKCTKTEKDQNIVQNL